MPFESSLLRKAFLRAWRGTAGPFLFCGRLWAAANIPIHGAGFLAAFIGLCSLTCGAQTVFVDFNAPGQYAGNFNPWEDDLAGGDGGDYAFEESTNAGVGGGGGVSVFQNTDTTATYRNGSWNFSTNGATIILSVRVKANGQTGNDKVQLGVLNSNDNGLLDSSVIVFESFRFLPVSATEWSLRECQRSGAATTETVLGSVGVVTGHWYKFEVSLTNTSVQFPGAFDGGCAIYDCGPDGLLPTTNIVTFATVQSHDFQDIAVTPTVWPALRAFQDAGIDAWDNFLVYQTDSAPVMTLPLTNNLTVQGGSPLNLTVLAEGPGAIGYSWYTNGTPVDGAVTGALTISAADNTYSNITVVAGNANGFITNSAAITVLYPPVITNAPAGNIQADSATVGGQVVAAGSDTPEITLYYGPVDGGTNAAAWAQSIALGLQDGAFAQAITGLSSNTTYYFTALAENSDGVAWAAPSQTFTTLAMDIYPAMVTNAAASNILTTTATLGGQVITTGGDPPGITLYYGPVDGGTNAGAWAQSVPLGLQAGAFTYSAGGLASNADYYFTAAASNYAGVTWAAPSQSFTTLLVNPPPPPVPLLTQQFDNSRCGANTNEIYLTLSNVNTKTFGRLFSYSVDGYVYGEPLVMTNVSIPGRGVHNALYIVTEHETVFAFDADAFDPVPFWTNSFIDPALGITTVTTAEVGPATDIVPEIGITSTPVIDPVSGTIYIEAKTREVTGGAVNYVHRLHALDVATGAERTNSPVVIGVTNYPGTGDPGYPDNDGAGHVLWNPLREHCRPALLLANGTVYLAFASHGDQQPYHGWVLGYDAQTLAQTAVFNTTPNGGLGGIWQSGNGLAADAGGNIYGMTGNGTYDTNGDYADSFLRLSTTNGLALADSFTPYNQDYLSTVDLDVGSSGLVLLPDEAGSPAHPHLLLGGSKGAVLYLLDRDNLGQFNSAGDTQIVQELPDSALGMWSSPAYFNGLVYVNAVNDVLKAFRISGGTMNPHAAATSRASYGFPGATPAVSANGTNDAIVWTIEADAFGSSGPAVLHAYNATNVAQELYNSSQLLWRDNPGPAVKMTIPAVVNGRVYVDAEYGVSVFGSSLSFLAMPVIQPNGGTFTNSTTVTLSDITPGAALYYTLDGTTPASNSIPYAGPFALTNTAQVQAIAFYPGVPSSGVVSASFVNSASQGTGTGLLGAYYAQPAAEFTNPPALIRTDSTVNFDWEDDLPNPGLGSNGFSVLWTGAVQPQYTEPYVFYTTATNGVRLWVNGQLLIDNWDEPAGTNETASTNAGNSINLNAQQLYNITMEYYQDADGGPAQLFWSSPSTFPAIVPKSQLYPVTNPPPAITLTAPADGSVFTANGTLTVMAGAAAQYNSLAGVAFYANDAFLGSVANSPYDLTVTGLSLAATNYVLTAVATDGSGLSTTSAPVGITFTNGSGLPYGLTARPVAAPFLNMPADISGALPATLSLTGVFTNATNLAPADGLIPYNVIAPLWSDGAVKTRWLAVPNGGAPYTMAQQIGFAPTGEWTFPAGTVFVKHFELVTDETNTNTPARRLETRLLVRNANGGVYGVTYKWRPDNSDADLLAGSLTEDIVITNAGGTRTQTWYYPGPADCLTCHNPAANYVLGVKTRQLNGAFTYPGGQTDNQLRTLNQLGLFFPAIDEGGITNYAHLAAMTDQTAPLEDRARSYLDANCALCHRPGGSGPSFDARWDTPLTNQNLINGVVVHGNLGADNARVVTPDDIWRSILYQRMASLDAAVKMPPLARNVVDTNSLAVIAAWINSLPGTPALAPPVLQPAGGVYPNPVSVTLLPPDTNAALYYTLDGSLPTTNSPAYSGPFTVTNNALLSVNAFETGFNNSVAATAQFTILSSGLQFFSETWLTNGTFQMSVAGQAGTGYVLQASTDLTNWVSLSTNLEAGGIFNLTDPGAGGFGYRFYRVLQP